MPDPRAVEARIAEVLREVDANFCMMANNPSDFQTKKFQRMAEVVAGALAPDFDKVTQAIWEMYAADTGRALPAGSADRLARAAVAAMGFSVEEPT